MPISKKLRFSVFERDNFTCQYCGKKPPEVILEADHIVSRKDGGGDEEMNLLTCCFACNRGKSSKSVDVEKMRKKTFKKELDELKEKKSQLEAYYDFLSKRDQIKKDELNIFQRCWEKCSNGENSLTDHGIKNIKKLSQIYDSDMIFEAIKISWDNDKVDSDEKFRYMCGILKRMQLDKDDPDGAESREQTRIDMGRFYGYWNSFKHENKLLHQETKDLVHNIFVQGFIFEDVKDYIDQTFNKWCSNPSSTLWKLLKDNFPN